MTSPRDTEILDDKETATDDNENTSANGNQNTSADDNKLTSANGNKEMNVDEHDEPSAVNDEKTSADDHEETPFTDVYSTDEEQVTIKHTSLACDLQGEMVLNEQGSIKPEMDPNVTNVSDKDVVLKQGLELIIAHPAEVVSSNPEEVSVEDKLDLDDFIEVELSNNTEVAKHMEQQTQSTPKCFAKEEQHLSEVLRASVVKPSTFDLDTSTMLGRKHYGSVRWCMDSCPVNAATKKYLYTVRTEPDIEGNVFNAHGDVTPLERQKSSDSLNIAGS